MIQGGSRVSLARAPHASLEFHVAHDHPSRPAGRPLPVTGRLPVHGGPYGETFRAFTLRADPSLLDPFLYVAHFWMSGPTFEPHPHAGFSAVTYLFDDSAGSFLNRDSRGDHSLIHPGDVHWTLAGAGVLHDERPTVTGQTCHGLQIFVNLPNARKSMAPRVMHLAAADVPRREDDGVRVSVPFGRLAGLESPLPVAREAGQDAALADVVLADGAVFRCPVEAHRNAFVHVAAGAVEIAGERLATGTAARVATGGVLEIDAHDDARVAIFAGTPLGEPVHMHGPFAMASAAEIHAAIERYQAGAMGRLDPLE